MQKMSSVQVSFTNDVPGDDVSLDRMTSTATKLPIRPEDFQSSLKVTLATVQGIWKKAEDLLSEPGSISSAPGYDSKCKMVLSRSGKRPHLVTCGRSGKFSCDNECPNWKLMNLCSHCVAVACVNDSLKEFCDQYRKSKHVPSVTQLLLTGLPTGLGKKGNRTTRK